MTKILLLLALALLGAWLFMRMRRPVAIPVEENKLPTPFAAVSIRGSDNACCRAKQLADERFLSSKAPDLPLPGCDASRCDCYFVHYDDRRRDTDRRSPFNVNTHQTGTGSFRIERRQGLDRRKAS